MDYVNSSNLFKAKKVARYIQLYGIRRTIVKAMSWYHMNREYDKMPDIDVVSNSQKNVGIIGCGKFAYANIAYFLNKNYGKVVRGVMDKNIDRAISLYKDYNADYYTDDESDILADDNVEIVYVASNHASHTEYAIKALNNGKNVHIEKPHSVSIEQLEKLCHTIDNTEPKVRLGFNRPESDLGQLVNSSLRDQNGKYMINWFVAGHKIDPDHWYHDSGEGGRILGNLCHWIDFTFQMIPKGRRFPIKIIPARSSDPDCDISVNFVFGDGSIGTITFSAKGHTFEGVRERLNAHRGNALASLSDFENVRIDIVDDIIKKNLWYRDHGHEGSIKSSYEMVRNERGGKGVEYVWNTGYLSIATKKALDSFQEITVEEFSESSDF